MFSLQRLVGGGDVFFDLLERSAAEAQESVHLLAKTLASPGAAALDSSVLVRRKEERITEELQELLITTFVTPLEREDIDALATALNKIPRTLERFTERFLICPSRVQQASFARQTELLQSSMDTLLTMVRDLRNAPDLTRMKERNDKLQYLEGEADKHMIELLQRLYKADHDAVSVVALKDLYDLLEKVIDRCRDAGNVIVQIVLKNS
ncbi:MAG: pit accessory protein [Verrucomicrobia bacterium]|nr:pit accessory protein [Verrucomicrobiota bacterium]